MAITIRFWAAARDAVGVPEEQVELDAPVSLAELTAGLHARHPLAAKRLQACSVLIDGLRGSEDSVVADGAVVEFLPPFAGG